MLMVLSGCTELYRWTDPPHGRATARHYEPLAAEGQYRVKAGDTVYSIAFRHQLDFRDLARWNGIGSDYLIRPGDVLRLSPSSAGTVASASSAGSSRPAARPESSGLPDVAPPAPHSWQWPTAGSVARTFSNDSKGLDIAGTLGQPVVAVAPGKIVYSGSALKGYGELVIIKHSESHLSAYGYNRRRLVQEGTMIAAGQPIAELGLGPEQKPMLHFEVREKGKPVNPMTFLQAR
ncbi:MAG: peptidoglycan DD-metalloendopeptidase family protein [Nevskiales bacterium]|nr:peptidoglycan DD-metalloendopeptidase family protein [Nevskiales bacterium]